MKFSKTLVIVESPTKCKKIEEYLGCGYKVIATCGHLRELTSLSQINMETFHVTYSIIEKKKQQIKMIKKEIISLDISLLLAGTKFRGEFEERLKNVLQLIKKSKKIILVIDEVHTLIGAGAAEGGVDAANILIELVKLP
jgi:DNA topoisomerase IA